jgi:PEP-CTERM motif
MRLLKKFMVVGLALAALALMPRRADAALLTINDGNDVWTLNMQENCTTCAVTLSVTYTAASARLGDLLQGVQWDLTDPNLTPSTIGFSATTAGTTSDWQFDFGTVSNGGCNFNATGSACGQWIGAGGGFTVATGTYSWSFNSTFDSNIGTPISGNIRAAYDVDPDGNGPLRANFSPGGGDFTPCVPGQCPGVTIPEPASMLLFGVAAMAMAHRVRRRASR